MNRLPKKEVQRKVIDFGGEKIVYFVLEKNH